MAETNAAAKVAESRMDARWVRLLQLVSVLVFGGIYVCTSGFALVGIGMVLLGVAVLHVRASKLGTPPEVDRPRAIAVVGLAIGSEAGLGAALDDIFPGHGSFIVGMVLIAVAVAALGEVTVRRRRGGAGVLRGSR